MWAARSADAVRVGLALGASLALGGCVSTQTLSARAELRATRLLASRQAQFVRTPDLRVQIASVTPLTGRRESAIAVTLHNATGSPLTDLPISVGIAHRDRIAWLNDRPGLAYFDTHVASLGPGATETWVLTTRAALPAGGRAIARVGAPATGGAHALPSIVASTGPTGAVLVRNDSDIPQDDLPVYGVVRTGGRVVAAGSTTIAHLAPNASTTVHIHLIGAAEPASISDALPTIYD